MIVYNNVKNCKFYASGTCADIYITNDNKIVKVVKLKNKHEFESKKRAIKSCYLEHEIINLIGSYKSYGVHIDKKYGFITMDKVPGKSLYDIFLYNDFKDIDPNDSIEIIKDWTMQLIKIHEIGVCHYSLHKSNLFLDGNKGYIIDFGNAILDTDYENEYKYIIHSDKIKNNSRKIFNIQDDFRFFIKNIKKFIDNIEIVNKSIEYYKIKSISKYITNKAKYLKENRTKKHNHAIDFYNFLLNLG